MSFGSLKKQKSEVLSIAECESSKITADPSQTDGEGETDPPSLWDMTQNARIYPPSADLLSTLMEYFPKIVPSVLIKKRSGTVQKPHKNNAFVPDCIPILATLIRDHPEVSCRRLLTKALFNLIKNPDDEQRQAHFQTFSNLNNDFRGWFKALDYWLNALVKIALHKRSFLSVVNSWTTKQAIELGIVLKGDSNRDLRKGGWLLKSWEF